MPVNETVLFFLWLWEIDGRRVAIGLLLPVSSLYGDVGRDPIVSGFWMLLTPLSIRRARRGWPVGWPRGIRCHR